MQSRRRRPRHAHDVLRDRFAARHGIENLHGRFLRPSVALHADDLRKRLNAHQYIVEFVRDRGSHAPKAADAIGLLDRVRELEVEQERQKNFLSRITWMAIGMAAPASWGIIEFLSKFIL